MLFGNRYRLPLGSETFGTKEELLLRATVLFARRGTDRVSLKDLAEDMGIRQSSIYNHFKSKDDLTEAVFDHIRALYELYINLLAERLSETESFGETVRVVLSHPMAVPNDFICMAFTLALNEQFYNETAYRLVKTVFKDYTLGELTKCLSKFLNPPEAETTAVLIIAVVFGAIRERVHEISGKQTENMYRISLNMLQDLIITHKEEGIK